MSCVIRKVSLHSNDNRLATRDDLLTTPALSSSFLNLRRPPYHRTFRGCKFKWTLSGLGLFLSVQWHESKGTTMHSSIVVPLFVVGLLSCHGTRAASLPATVVDRDVSLQPFYDLIIIGGGTAGLTVADRLTENSQNTANLTISMKAF